MRCLLRFTHSLGAVVRQGGIKGAHTGKRADGVKAYVDAMLKAIQVCSHKPAAACAFTRWYRRSARVRLRLRRSAVCLRLQWVVRARVCSCERACARDLLPAFTLGCTWIRRFR